MQYKRINIRGGANRLAFSSYLQTPISIYSYSSTKYAVEIISSNILQTTKQYTLHTAGYIG